jgi:AcrR family transcriptional regulator
VYRRYPDKELLIDTLFQEHLDAWAQLVEEGLNDPDPRHAIVDVHERALELSGPATVDYERFFLARRAPQSALDTNGFSFIP